MANSVVSAILAATSDANVRLAMLLGSYLESGWRTDAVGDNGTSFGPFQIHLPAHPGVTQAEAEDPATAVHLMLPAYEAAVGRVSASTWKNSPEQAAETAAYYAERPAQTYYAARGSDAVGKAYQAAVGALGGKFVPGAGSGSPSSSGSPTLLDSLGNISDALTGMEKDAAQFMRDVLWISNPSNWVRIFSGVFGFLFLVAGLYFVAKGAGD
jgi:hypothetical protein